MKTKVLEALRNKYKNLGFNNSELESLADYLTQNITDESNIDDVVAKAESLLQVFQKSADKLRGEKAQKEKELKELQEQLKKLSPDDLEKEGKEGKGTQSDELTKKLDAIMDRLNKIEGEKTSSTRKSQIEKILESLPTPIQKAYSHIDLGKLEAEQYEALLEEIKGEAKEITEGLKAQGAVFGAPKVVKRDTKKNEASTEEAKEVLDSLNI